MIFAQQQQYGFENITKYEGVGISITGIAIVFVALILISLFIYGLPRVLAMLESVLPPEADHHRSASPAPKRTDQDEALVAAIGFALHQRHRKTK